MIRPSILVMVLAGSVATASRAQTGGRSAPALSVVASGDETYLRYLQLAGLSPLYPWSVRDFSSADLTRLAAPTGGDPWLQRIGVPAEAHSVGAELLPATIAFRFNSAFPYGGNDGAIWAGRGVTSSIDAGVKLRFGPMVAILDPIAFRAENAGFQLLPNGQTGPAAFGDAIFPTGIDHPQRFGNSPYSRVDPGQSGVQLDLFGVAAGVSTANMGWGPMEEFPYILGANAAGFPHAYVGTAKPRNVWLGQIHGRVVWGELYQSPYSPVTGTRYFTSLDETGTRRFASGLVATFIPRGVPGLEIGAARFFHSVWPRDGIPRSYLLKPFEGVLKKGLRASPGVAGTDDNQLASVFARWAFPKNGFEVYGEYGHEDHNYDFRDLIQEPDHSRIYGLGMRKVFHSDSAGLSGFRAELINYELPTLARHRGEGSIYAHFIIRQGHTNYGQILGTDAGVGSGAAEELWYDRYDRSGRTSFGWTRLVHQEEGQFYQDGVVNPRSVDVSHTISAERVRFYSGMELTAGVGLVREFNRNFSGDAWNLNSILSATYRFR